MSERIIKMLPHKHFLFSLPFAIILILIVPEIHLIGFLLIILSAVLIDFDHYLYYAIKTRNPSLIAAYNLDKERGKKLRLLPLLERRKSYINFCCFHGLEISLLFLILTFSVSEYFAFIFIGVIFHLFLDYSDQWKPGERKDKLFLTYDFLKFRKLRYLE